VVPLTSGRTPTASLAPERPSRQVLFQIAKDAPALRDRWSRDAPAPVSLPSVTMAAQVPTSRSTVVDTANLPSAVQTRPTVPVRPSSLSPSDLQSSTPVTRDVPSHHEDELAVFTHMAVNEAAFTPEHFQGNISNILTKATQRIGVFFRGFSSRHIALMKMAFITYIRPSLEFNSNIWNPTKKYLIDELESIQRRFTKRVPSISHLSYLERLRALDLEPLELKAS